MKKIYYIINVIGLSPLLFSILLCGLVTLVLFSNTVIVDSDVRFQISTKYLAWGSAFLSTILVAYSFRPEDDAQIEIEASLPTPFYKIIGMRFFINNLLIISPFIGTVIIINHFTIPKIDISLVRALIILVITPIFFGGIALLGASLGRKSAIGTMYGLFFVIVFSLLPIPGNMHPFLQNVTSAVYNDLTPIIYLLIGVIAFIISLVILQDINYLLIGKERAVFLNNTEKNSNPNKYRAIIEIGFQKLLLDSLPIFIKGAIYEASQWIVSGWLPIMIGGMIVFWGVIVLAETDNLYGLAIDFPRSITMFSLILLPPVVCDTIPSDQRRHRTSLMLSCISSRTYLAIKIIGVWLAILITLILGTTPFYIILGFNLLTGFPQYLIAATVVFLLAVIPLLSYISAISLLLGALTNRQPAYAIGAAISIISIIAYVLTSNTIGGNFLFPSGTMVIETTANWLSNQVGTFHFSIIERPIVPFYLLPLPVVAAAGQIAFIWLLSIRRLEHKDK